MSNKRERLQYGFYNVELRQAENETDSLPTLTGHAAVFNTEVEIQSFMGTFLEEIAPGAFTRAINEKQDVRALFNHDPNKVLGRTSSGTLSLREDDKGLYVEIQPPNTALGNEVVELIRRGDVSQMSFGFVVTKEKVEKREGYLFKRTILDVDLFDVSPVTFPAFDTTDIGIEQSFRSADNILDSVQKQLDKLYVPNYKRKAKLLSWSL
ncbi:HK97 family phage prohead protease [Candidatus Parcubacteria bacterium]|nr:MAG: HK97 family phage prohead protease [Candidatus Parcubacteria bacterium]